MTKRLKDTLQAALKAGGAELRRGLGHATVKYKTLGRANAVTQFDHASEAAILEVIGERFPDHDFLAEERGARRSGSDFLWVIDPLDGTLNFSHAVPIACVSIGLVHRGRALVGGVYDPFREELFLAEAGAGATLNRRRIRVSRAAKLKDALMVTGFPYDRNVRAVLYSGLVRDFLRKCQDLRRSGSAALDLAWVAAGRYEGFWEFRLNPWDVAAGRLLVEEAGGKVSDFAGRPWREVDSWGAQTLATNSRIHREAVSLLHPASAQS